MSPQRRGAPRAGVSGPGPLRPDDTEVARPRARDLLGFPEGAGMAACRGNQAGRNGNPRRTSQTTLTKYHAPKPASTKRTDLNLSVPRKR
ncbi:MAG: hypothetical protein H6R12_1555 [Proteobacteria bacterium]|nr:hypothetical protein [Pseudomonadota bacterium]